MNLDEFKKQAARRAVEGLSSGMVVGLGTGSTVRFALEFVAESIHSGELTNIVGVPTSERTVALAQRLGIALTTLDDHPEIDMTIDGADEVDPQLNLIKGGGGALLREKIVAQASKENVIIVDESKLSPCLGTHWALPVEVVPFARRTEEEHLVSLGAAVQLRRDTSGGIFETDQGNWILDAQFGPIPDAKLLAQKLDQRAGVVEHGLFLGMATRVVVAGAAGVRVLESARR